MSRHRKKEGSPPALNLQPLLNQLLCTLLWHSSLRPYEPLLSLLACSLSPCQIWKKVHNSTWHQKQRTLCIRRVYFSCKALTCQWLSPVVEWDLGMKSIWCSTSSSLLSSLWIRREAPCILEERQMNDLGSIPRAWQGSSWSSKAVEGSVHLGRDSCWLVCKNFRRQPLGIAYYLFSLPRTWGWLIPGHDFSLLGFSFFFFFCSLKGANQWNVFHF